MDVEDIWSVKAGHGTILVKPLKANNYANIGDSKIYVDTSYQKEKHSISYGEVISVCDTIPDSLRTTIEVHPGDIVFFHYLCVMNAIRDKKFLESQGQVYYSIPYESLYVSKRNPQSSDQIICLNGFMLVTPTMEHSQDKIGKIFLPECMMAQEQVSRGRVAFIGSPLDGDKEVINPGVNVIFRKSSAVPLEYGLHQSLERKYYRMKRDSILAVSE